MRLRPPAIFQCSCSTQHHSADGIAPAGWTTRHGQAWCPDCTKAGAPVRQLLHGGSRAARRAA